jgi:hypothetical protein
MTDSSMALETVSLEIPMLNNLADDDAMALHAVLLEQASIRFGDSDRLREILQRERDSMLEPVARFGEPLLGKIVGDMASITRGYGVVAGARPAVIDVVHNMTIDARSRVIREVRASPGVDERKDSKAQGYAQSDKNGDL